MRCVILHRYFYGVVYMFKLIYSYGIITIFCPIIFVIPSFISKVIFGYNLHTWEIYSHFLVKYCLNIKFIIYGEPLIENGIILSNHINFTDGGIDCVINKSEGVFRFSYLLFTLLIHGIITYIEDWGICIHRGKTTRQQLIYKIKNKLKTTNRILLYPEGTRQKYYNQGKITKEFLRDKIKYGTLVSIYEVLPTTKVQIIISLNKDKIANNIFSTNIPVNRSKPILPSDYKTVDDFLEKILDTFIETHNELYDENKYTEWKPNIDVIPSLFS